MSMLELITKASSAELKQSSADSQYPIVLNPDPAFLTLISQNQQPNNDTYFLKPVQGWSLSETDTEIIDLSQKLLKKLQIKLKNTNSFTKLEFINILNSYLEKSSQKLGITISDIKPENNEGYTKKLVEKLGFLMGEGVLSLVIEGCVMFETWDVLECLIVKGFVVGSCCKGLVSKLVEKRKAGLVCLCVKYVSDLELLDVLLVLKYFLSGTTKDGFGDVREEWEREAVSAIETATLDKSVGEKKLSLAKEAAVLLMMGHDGFTASELCLHYLIASPNVDDVIFAACVGKLNGLEIMGFCTLFEEMVGEVSEISQACLSVKGGSSMLGLKALESVPSLEVVTKCFGLVIDEHFSSLVMHPEFCEEVKSVEVVVNSLASEARLCCTLANLSASLKN